MNQNLYGTEEISKNFMAPKREATIFVAWKELALKPMPC